MSTLNMTSTNRDNSKCVFSYCRQLKHSSSESSTINQNGYSEYEHSKQQDNHLSQINIQRLLRLNIFIIKFANYFASLEIPFRRYSFGIKSFSTCMARLRFYFFVWFMVRMILFLVFHSCKYNYLRYYLHDFTVYYSLDRRTSLTRSFICLCLLHLTLKGSVLFRPSTIKGFDTSLIDHLSKIPEGCGSVGQNKTTNSRVIESLSLDVDEKTNSTLKVCSICGTLLTCQQSSVKDYDPDFVIEYHNSTSTQNNGQEREADHKDKQVILRDSLHWIHISKKVQKSFITIVILFVPFGVFVIILCSYRMAFVHKSERDCDIKSFYIKIFGAIEIFFCLSESLMALIGMFTHTKLVQLDIEHQADRIEQELIQMNKLIVDKRLNSIGYLRHHQTEWFDETDEQKFDSIHQRSTAYHLSDIMNQNGGGLYLRSTTRSHSTRTNTIPNLMNQTVPIFIASQLPLQQAEPSYLSGQSAIQIIDAQKKVVQLLNCIDRFKPLIAFIGKAQYIWMISSLSFVPLLKSPSQLTKEISVPILIYLYFCCIAVGSCTQFTATCARVNQRVSARVKFKDLIISHDSKCKQ